MQVESLPVRSLIADSYLQPRVKVEKWWVDNLVTIMKDEEEREKFEPIDVFFIEAGISHKGKPLNEGYYIVDGFHRHKACEILGIETFKCKIHKGTYRDALKFAIHANMKNRRFPLKDADKRRAVEHALADSEWSKWSNPRIAELCGVGLTLVHSIRGEVPDTPYLKDKVVGKDGKEYKRERKPRKKVDEKVKGRRILERFILKWKEKYPMVSQAELIEWVTLIN